MKNLFAYSSKLTKAVFIGSIAFAAIYLYKTYVRILEGASVEGFDPYSPESQKTFIVLLGFVVMFLGSFLRKPYRVWVCTLALSLPVWIFAGWWRHSYRIIQNPNVGWLAKENKLGLVGAEWEHVFLFLTTLFLLVVGMLEIVSYGKEERTGAS
jgi:hypothetical protein